MALTLSAGLQLEDSEFVQFHPTGLAHTGILLSEAARAEGGRACATPMARRSWNITRRGMPTLPRVMW